MKESLLPIFCFIIQGKGSWKRFAYEVYLVAFWSRSGYCACFVLKAAESSGILGYPITTWFMLL